MAKVGRPAVDTPKLKKVTIRMSDKDYERLMEYNKAHDMTITETMAAAFNQYMETEEKK